jgi:hypothetical protein
MISKRKKNKVIAFLFLLYTVFNLFIPYNFVLGQCDFNKISAGMMLYDIGKFEEAKLLIVPCVLSKSFNEPKDNNDFYSIKYVSMIPLLVKSIQELTTTIEFMREEIDILKQKNIQVEQ